MTTDTQRAAFEALLDTFEEDRASTHPTDGTKGDQARAAVLAAFDAARGTAEQVRRDAFEVWWATMEAKGYRYGDDALENVRMGFEGALAASPAPETPRTTDEAVGEVVAGIDCQSIKFLTPSMFSLAPGTKLYARTMAAQPTNAEDAAAGNPNAIRHIAYAEGYRDGQAMATQPASPAPSPRIEAEPVARHVDLVLVIDPNGELPGLVEKCVWCGHLPDWKQGEQWAWDLCQQHINDAVDRGVEGASRWYATRVTSAPPARTPDARSTSDAADGSRSIEQLRIDLAETTRRMYPDRATRSTDSSAEAAESHKTWCVRQCDRLLADHRWNTTNLFDQGARAALTILRDQCAEAPKLTTAPHTADETRVEGGAT